ncbi:hypothetical protein AN191_03660 [Loktanella sp. 5RATIMAR09]|uniref:hypothetical protein n=1 Tax=Loktanella sp. 5RATIMAR09 TaxID=1225655 RepID=UPI00070792A3|nr:hypothetical protein [Loktanella sp. 5RATIMAR09]KQI73011.1 hypothetical protein AN191_03660 [Loktanella sp. 5RATIMAR09]
MKLIPALVLSLMAASTFALDSIGTVTARLEGADLSWQVLTTDDGAAMVQVNTIGPLTMMDTHAMGDGNVYIGLVFQDEPSIDATPVGITIDISPEGAAGPVWTSAGASVAPTLSIEKLNLDGAGRIEAGFEAMLCHSGSPAKCETVVGRIDTDLGLP